MNNGYVSIEKFVSSMDNLIKDGVVKTRRQIFENLANSDDKEIREAVGYAKVTNLERKYSGRKGGEEKVPIAFYNHLSTLQFGQIKTVDKEIKTVDKKSLELIIKNRRQRVEELIKSDWFRKAYGNNIRPYDPGDSYKPKEKVYVPYRKENTFEGEVREVTEIEKDGTAVYFGDKLYKMNVDNTEEDLELRKNVLETVIETLENLQKIYKSD